MRSPRSVVPVIALALALASPLIRADITAVAAPDVAAEGGFSCDFQVDPNQVPFDTLAPVIERDRIYMALQPGMLHKHIPIRPDPATQTIFGGGRYLFDTFENAKDYKDFVSNRFILDGTNFFDRPGFLNPDCDAWSAIGAHDFGDIHDSQIVLRTERWAVPAANQRPLLKDRWPAVRAEAERRGLTSVWLLYNKQERLVSLVYFANRIGPDTGALDPVSLAVLEASPPLGGLFSDQQWAKTFDRTMWTLTIWFPTVYPDQGEPSLWPNSPPLPEPGPTDGVCEPSRAEDHATAPNDCSPNCGDGTWDADENNRNCPSDVPAF